MKQLTLNLFQGEKIETVFDSHFNTPDGRGFYTRRDKDGTFLTIGSLNFLGKYSGVEFRFYSKPFDDNNFKNVVEPELHNMSLSRIKEFVAHVIYNLDMGKYAWNYEHRAKDYCSIINAEENMVENYGKREAVGAMVEFYKISRELEAI